MQESLVQSVTNSKWRAFVEKQTRTAIQVFSGLMIIGPAKSEPTFTKHYVGVTLER